MGEENDFTASTSGSHEQNSEGKERTDAKKKSRCTGYGRYSTKNGMTYEGEFLDDMYHGKGQIICPDGTRFEGIWQNGTLVKGQLVFPDGLVYDAGMPGSDLPDSCKPWGYCDGYDRRFWNEIQNDLPGKASLGAVDPIPMIPKSAMDVRNGYYDTETRKIFTYEGKFSRNVDDSEHFWIISTCRKGWMEEVGRIPKTHF